MFCSGCGTSLIWHAEVRKHGGNPLPGLHLKPLSLVDEQVTGLEILRILAPAGWELRGGDCWQVSSPGRLAAVAFQIVNPHGLEAFEALPEMSFAWNGNLFSGLLEPAGRNCFGAQVQKPVDARTALEAFVLPAYRGDVEELDILGYEPLPDLPRLVRAEALLTPDGTAEGGKVRMRYARQGNLCEEELYGIVEVFRALNPGMFRVTEADFWFINHLFSLRAEAGKLDAAGDLFATMFSSFWLNPNWYAAARTLTQLLIQKPASDLPSIAGLRRLLAKAPGRLREEYLRNWYARQEAYEEISPGRPRSIRPLEGFIDPYCGEVIVLPRGYRVAWANPAGEFVLSGELNFIPEGEWTRMERVEAA
ncbi:MAG: hypothetical protein IT308_13595 [Anaerolineaceae bacterium]|nr:hypothetical protein [Anaerolineaceae bacterium]